MKLRCKDERRLEMILSEDYKDYIYNYTIKYKNDYKYIACSMQKCQEEKKENNNGRSK